MWKKWMLSFLALALCAFLGSAVSAEAAKKATGKEIAAKLGARRAGDPAQLIASSEKARRILGWQPRFTDVHEIIATAWKWHEKHPNGYGD